MSSNGATNQMDTRQFQPVDPWKSEDLTYKRRNLPHLEVPGATYFVTFRCQSTIKLIPDVRDLVMTVIQACDRTSIDLDAAVVMPDHTHLIFRLIEPATLGLVIRRIKGRSSRLINQLLKREGPLWIDESFDHIIRHESELAEKIEYIRNNPIKKGLASRSDEYPWLFIRSIAG